jgi:hypothetical protein
LLAAALALGLVAVAPAPAAADQTIEFDEAGDAPHISLVGDSTLSGVRWYSDYGALERFNFVLSAESCRRTIEQSCISREGYRSQNVLSAMQTLDGQLGEVLVVMSGYNDPADSIGEAIAGVVEEARQQGVERVVWLTLRTSADVDYSDPQEQSSVDTFREYNDQLVAAAEASGGYLQIADWATYSDGASAWFGPDGVHLSPRGVDAVTTFIADVVDRVLAGEDVSPAVAPWAVLLPGAEGDVVRAVQEALIAAGIDVPGGADGVYGDSTMIAVAEFQRRNAALDETGAVDEATAIALGVHTDPEAPTTTTAGPSTTVAGAAPAAPDVASITPTAATASGGSRATWWWPLAVAAVVLVVAFAALVARRRYVVAQRAARRWARVHPATSPHRSVADMRRAGELPARPGRGIYDHELEDAVAITTD